MEITSFSHTTTSPTRKIAINALAVVGFIVLIVLGMGLAIYAATFVPKAADRLGAAAVYISQVFVPAEKPAAIEVVSPGTTVPFDGTPGAGIATSTATTSVATATTPATTPTPAAGTPDYHVYPTGGTKTPAALYGLSDLTVSVLATGYLTSADTASFVASSSVPSDMRGAVKFMITNRGTNTTGNFDFKAVLPSTSSNYTFTSDTQTALLPGEHVEYTLGFDRARVGNNREISITVDPDKRIVESNENNNDVTTTVTIK